MNCAAVDDSHRPVLLDQVVEAMAIRADGWYVDGTFGRGGHAAAIRSRLGPDARLWLVDRDPRAVAAAQSRFGDDPRCEVLRGNFAELDRLVPARGRIDGVLLDVGVSSPQLDDAARGFSFYRDGPLDMRMDPDTGISAADWLHTAAPGDIVRVLREFGEEPQARRIVRTIVAAREGARIATTGALARLVEEAVPARFREAGRHPATRTFQAIRVYINGELDALRAGLEAGATLLAPGGRLAVISFHSLEDRIVKRFMRDRSRVDPALAKLPVVPESARPTLRLVGKARRADASEVQANARARSAVLRVAERLS